MNRQESAGKRENWMNIAGVFSEPLGDILGNVGSGISDWTGWGDDESWV
jgi:hypothetical protein